jgi:3-hydroxy-3-methylglutaryl CoA synthase
MIGIESYGVYFPLYRLSRSEIGKVWGMPGGPGEKAVANIDEDAVTMGVEAGFDCLAGIDASKVDGLIFATTTAPYRLKALAPAIAMVLGLPKKAFTLDLTDTLRAGTSAIKIATDQIKSGTCKKVLVIASEVRFAEQESFEEQMSGDGAAVVLVSQENLIADFRDSYSISDEIVGVWRKENDAYDQHFEDKIEDSFGFQGNVLEAIKGLVAKTGIEVKEIGKLACSYFDPRGLMGVAGKLGLNPMSQLSDPLFTSIGNPGVSAPIIAFANALENTQPKQDIILASHGDGADALLFTTTDKLKSLPPRTGIKGNLARKAPLFSYEQYAKFRKVTKKDRQEPKASPVIHWRDKEVEFGFLGEKCKSCGTIQFPLQRVCIVCQSKDNFEKVKLTRKGTIYTFTNDYIRSGGAQPVPWCVIDLQNGGRIFLTMTDCEPTKVKIGQEVDIVFRIYHDGGGFRNYYWRCRPAVKV